MSFLDWFFGRSTPKPAPKKRVRRGSKSSTPPPSEALPERFRPAEKRARRRASSETPQVRVSISITAPGRQSLCVYLNKSVVEELGWRIGQGLDITPSKDSREVFVQRGHRATLCPADPAEGTAESLGGTVTNAKVRFPLKGLQGFAEGSIRATGALFVFEGSGVAITLPEGFTARGDAA